MVKALNKNCYYRDVSVNLYKDLVTQYVPNRESALTTDLWE